MATSRDQLQFARIYQVDKSGKEKKAGGTSVNCMFNPYEYIVSKTNSYDEKSKNSSDVPQVEFKKAGPQTLRLSLIFDSYEKKEDISKTTCKLWKLMESKTRQEGNKNKKIPPPEVAFEWGVFRFVAVITEMTQTFTLFTHTGIPVRAKVDVTFTQHKDLKDYSHQNPTSGGGPLQRSWIVTAGDRLDTIAYDVYGDAMKWRIIADHNHLTNPLHLVPGQELMIPLE